MLEYIQHIRIVYCKDTQSISVFLSLSSAEVNLLSPCYMGTIYCLCLLSAPCQEGYAFTHLCLLIALSRKKTQIAMLNYFKCHGDAQLHRYLPLSLYTNVKFMNGSTPVSPSPSVKTFSGGNMTFSRLARFELILNFSKLRTLTLKGRLIKSEDPCPPDQESEFPNSEKEHK